ncbi:uncharacterized protein LOC111519640 isoform X1 [Drosophila willistoni]|uniref:uncharacterized protein LOC111519640 isoform X1 n=1 Tax=Drosophila willistoni TaxID=7260 RepID=UPI000C26C818|nr:uncharacterized protein LOC111519640 isoform X1 [Drosophila willistoni]
MQTTDPMKRETVEKQLVYVLKTSTQSGVIQRKNDYYCASTYVEDVKRILMDDSKWFTPSASPSEISLGTRSQISRKSQMTQSTAVSTKSAESSVNKDLESTNLHTKSEIQINGIQPKTKDIEKKMFSR